MRILFLTWATVLGFSTSALATPTADETARARQLYQQGTTAYDLQKYAEAAELYEQAYSLKNEPALLFNIGQAYRLAGNYQKAMGAFRSFLRRVPDAKNRVEVEARIADMQKLVEDQQKNKPPTNLEPLTPKPVEPTPVVAPPPVAPAVIVTPPPAPRPGRTMVIAGASTAVAGVVLIAVGGGLYAGAKSAFNDIQNAPPGTPFDPSKQSQMHGFEAGSYALFGIGAAATIAGVSIAVLGARRNSAAEKRVWLAPAGLGLTAGGAF